MFFFFILDRAEVNKVLGAFVTSRLTFVDVFLFFLILEWFVLNDLKKVRLSVACTGLEKVQKSTHD